MLAHLAQRIFGKTERSPLGVPTDCKVTVEKAGQGQLALRVHVWMCETDKKQPEGLLGRNR